MLFEEDPENPAGRIPTKGPGAVQVPHWSVTLQPSPAAPQVMF